MHPTRKPLADLRGFHLLVYALTIVLSLVFIFVANRSLAGQMNLTASVDRMDVAVARITGTETVEALDQAFAEDSEEAILFTAEVTRGGRKGEVLRGVQSFSSFVTVLPEAVEEGDKVLLYRVPQEHYGTEWVFAEYIRTDALMILGLIFAALLLLFGRLQGFQTLVSLLLTVMAVFMVFIPAVLVGKNIYLWSVVICLYITVVTLVLVGGANKKSLAAMIGCTAGIAFAAAMVLLMDGVLHLTGVVNDESVYLTMLDPENPIDLKAIFFGAILIGAMGAIMDVAMSIASSLKELAVSAREVSFAGLVRSGLTIGRDIMGTMANTLVLAYIGSSLATVLLLVTYFPDPIDLLNQEMVVIEILQALIGSFAILFTLPLTAVASALLFTRIHS